jgi:hypothetical protein
MQLTITSMVDLFISRIWLYGYGYGSVYWCGWSRLLCLHDFLLCCIVVVVDFSGVVVFAVVFVVFVGWR